MEIIEVNTTVRVISSERTEILGFGCSVLTRMLGQVFPISHIDRFSDDKMFRINGIWVAQKDCVVFIEDTMESIKPPTFIFDAKNLI